jgi:threonine dehydrogenase-like Zn-dependent dehydrogenase
VLNDEVHGCERLLEGHEPHPDSDRLAGRMRAIVIEQPNVVALKEVETPEPGRGEVRVRSVLAGVCRTDLDILTGILDTRFFRYPVVPGHEWSGVVDAVGEGVTGLEPGRRVVCEGNIGCMSCARCRAGDTHLCSNYDAVGFTRGGGWGEFVVVPARILHPLPDHVSFEAAALVEPGSCVVKALGRAAIRPAETVGVVGVGAMGALTIRIARLHSPGTIVAFGVRAEELELACRLGADAVVNVAEEDAEAETGRLVGGGFDVVVETAGAVPAVELSTRLAREGGRVVLLGIAGQEEMLTLPADRIPLRDLTVLGSVGYTTAAWAQMVGLLRERLVELEPIVTHRFPLERFEDAFALMDERRGIVARIVLEHAGN